MNTQENNRFDNSALSRELCTVIVLLPGGAKIQSKMNYMSSYDARLTLPTDEFPAGELLEKNVSIQFPLLDMIVTGMCVNTNLNPNATITMNINFINYYEQSKIDCLLKNLIV